MYPAITAGVTVFLDSKDLPITYANVNPTRRKPVNCCIGPYEIHRILGNAVELYLPDDMTIYDTVSISSLKVHCMDNSRIVWQPLAQAMPPSQLQITTQVLREQVGNTK